MSECREEENQGWGCGSAVDQRELCPLELSYGWQDGCEPPCAWWELNSGPLAEQSDVLIKTDKHKSPCCWWLVEREWSP